MSGAGGVSATPLVPPLTSRDERSITVIIISIIDHNTLLVVLLLLLLLLAVKLRSLSNPSYWLINII